MVNFEAPGNSFYVVFSPFPFPLCQLLSGVEQRPSLLHLRFLILTGKARSNHQQVKRWQVSNSKPEMTEKKRRSGYNIYFFKFFFLT